MIDMILSAKRLRELIKDISKVRDCECGTHHSWQYEEQTLGKMGTEGNGRSEINYNKLR